MKEKNIVLSGIRPTGKLHIGNYFGALKHFIKLQNASQCYFFIADLHSLNEPYRPGEKYHQILELAAEFLAAGLNPKKCVFFTQSQIHEHSELAIIFSNVIPLSYLYRMTQFKEKSESYGDSINSGLLYYPVLMAADILLYKPTHIPVGDDQAQHVELARDVARFFHKRFGEMFTEPKTLLTAHPKIMSISNPEKKMSKSLGDEHCIYIDDSPENIFQKIAKAPTDTGDGKSPGAKNLFLLLQMFANDQTNKKFAEDAKAGRVKYSELKKVLSKSISEYFKKFLEEKKKLMESPEKIEKILSDGAKKAQKVANKTLDEVKKKVGILR